MGISLIAVGAFEIWDDAPVKGIMTGLMGFYFLTLSFPSLTRYSKEWYWSPNPSAPSLENKIGPTILNDDPLTPPLTSTPSPRLSTMVPSNDNPINVDFLFRGKEIGPNFHLKKAELTTPLEESDINDFSEFVFASPSTPTALLSQAAQASASAALSASTPQASASVSASYSTPIPLLSAIAQARPSTDSSTFVPQAIDYDTMGLAELFEFESSDAERMPFRETRTMTDDFVDLKHLAEAMPALAMPLPVVVPHSRRVMGRAMFPQFTASHLNANISSNTAFSSWHRFMNDSFLIIGIELTNDTYEESLYSLTKKIVSLAMIWRDFNAAPLHTVPSFASSSGSHAMPSRMIDTSLPERLESLYSQKHLVRVQHSLSAASLQGHSLKPTSHVSYTSIQRLSADTGESHPLTLPLLKLILFMLLVNIGFYKVILYRITTLRITPLNIKGDKDTLISFSTHELSRKALLRKNAIKRIHECRDAKALLPSYPVLKPRDFQLQKAL